MTGYDQLFLGSRFYLDKKDTLFLACCCCGTTHKIKFKVDKKGIRVVFNNAEKHTRKHRKELGLSRKFINRLEENEMKVLDHGYVELIESWGSDERIIEAARLWEALGEGYSVNALQGVVYGKKGEKLGSKSKPCEKEPYLLLNLSLSSGRYSVRAHRFIAFVLFGEDIFLPGMQVRHLDGNPRNNKAANLVLGTAKENEADKAPVTRSRVSSIARAAQPYRSFNARLNEVSANNILQELNVHRNANGRIQRGAVKSLAHKYKVSASTISLIGKGATWN